jgi:glucokinase
VPQPTQYALVYDVGGSHVSTAVCAQHTYALRGLTRAPLPASESGGGHFSASSFVRLIHALGEAAAKSARRPLSSIAGACLAMPGPFDYQAGISHMQHKLHSLYNFDLKSALAAHFHWQPTQIRFVNDAAAFTLGEAGAGAAKGYSRVVGLTLGTGIGAAFAVHTKTGGSIADSSIGNAEGVPLGGELWNLPYNGATVEDFVSTRYLRDHYAALTGLEEEVSTIADTAQGDHPCPEIPTPQPQSTPQSVSHLDPNDPYAAHCRARQTFQDFGRHLGLALNQHAAAFHPDVIVLGGGIARASALFLPATRKALAFQAQIAISTLMDEAPLAGAGVHWFSTLSLRPES